MCFYVGSLKLTPITTDIYSIYCKTMYWLYLCCFVFCSSFSKIVRLQEVLSVEQWWMSAMVDVFAVAKMRMFLTVGWQGTNLLSYHHLFKYFDGEKFLENRISIINIVLSSVLLSLHLDNNLKVRWWYVSTKILSLEFLKKYFLTRFCDFTIKYGKLCINGKQSWATDIHKT